MYLKVLQVWTKTSIGIVDLFSVSLPTRCMVTIQKRGKKGVTTSTRYNSFGAVIPPELKAIGE